MKLPGKILSATVISSLITHLLISAMVNGAPIVNVEQTYYTVTGTTAAEIRSNLNRESPVKIGNTSFDAYTRWHVSWEYQYVELPNSCGISEITTYVEIQQILPRLISTLSSHLQNKWRIYYMALLNHENTHGNFARQAAHEIEVQLSAISPQSSCREIEDKANSIGYKIIEKYVAREKLYDKNTHHGVTEGARFP